MSDPISPNLLAIANNAASVGLFAGLIAVCAKSSPDPEKFISDVHQLAAELSAMGYAADSEPAAVAQIHAFARNIVDGVIAAARDKAVRINTVS